MGFTGTIHVGVLQGTDIMKAIASGVQLVDGPGVVMPHVRPTTLVTLKLKTRLRRGLPLRSQYVYVKAGMEPVPVRHVALDISKKVQGLQRVPNVAEVNLLVVMGQRDAMLVARERIAWKLGLVAIVVNATRD